jgi:hypothetical protein
MRRHARLLSATVGIASVAAPAWAQMEIGRINAAQHSSNDAGGLIVFLASALAILFSLGLVFETIKALVTKPGFKSLFEAIWVNGVYVGVIYVALRFLHWGLLGAAYAAIGVIMAVVLLTMNRAKPH